MRNCLNYLILLTFSLPLICILNKEYNTELIGMVKWSKVYNIIYKNFKKETKLGYTVKRYLTTTCEQQPPVNNGQFESSTTSLNISFIRHLCQTAAFYWSQGWSLYRGLTVESNLCTTTNFGTEKNSVVQKWPLFTH